MEEVKQAPVSPEPKKEPKNFFDKFFGITERGSSIFRELIGGLVTFLAMFYILPVNSGILSNWGQGTTTIYEGVVLQNSQLMSAVFVATALAAGVTTIFMGLFGKLPVGLASGMGLNAMISTTVMGALGFNFAQAMALVLVDGLIFLIISVTPLRTMIVKAIPKSLKIGISAGIGFFIAYLGLKNAGIIKVTTEAGLAIGDLTNPSVLIALIGIVAVLALSALPQKNKVTFWLSKFSVIIVMVVLGTVSAIMGEAGVNGMPHFLNEGGMAQFDNYGTIFGACFRGFDAFARPEAYAVVFSLMFVDFFDTTGTLVGVEMGAGMVNEKGEVTVNDRNAMIVDAAATSIGAIAGTSTVTSFVESTTGTAAGARTGLAAVATGVLFLLSLLIYPVLGMFSGSVPNIALVYVGVCMFINLKDLEWKEWVDVGAVFVTVIAMICMASISDGMAFGFGAYVLMKAASGKYTKKDIPVTCIAAAFIILYVIKIVAKIS